ncbi:MAG: sodium/glutamate symporter [Calditrichaceae bacterium]|nr:sodium/glutamate symporter [Calditrichia bacterium]NUQ43620.1 sodium/glutamate symporter [Calditrichaceae bacterium]
MQWHFTPAGTLAFAALALFVGRLIIAKVRFLQEYSIPAPVIGGLIPAIAVALLRLGGMEFTFDASLQPGLLLAFFATVGLSADLRLIARGGRALLLFFGCVVAVIVLQNLIGVGLALAMGVDPLIGLLAGSISMSGGHGTAAAWGAKFSESYGLSAATGIGLAAATFGLVVGGLLGGPVGKRLTAQLRSRGRELGTIHEPGLNDAAEAKEPFTPDRLITSIFLIAACSAVGNWLCLKAENPAFTLPPFVWTLFVGVVLRNLFSLFRTRDIDSGALDFAGSVALSLFLAMALMSLKLWELAALAGPMLAILPAQAVLVWLFVTRVTFPVTGRDYDAALLAAGQTGFALGATPTALVNMETLAKRYGWSARAFLIVPIVGAFMIDLANAVVLSGFVQVLARWR